MRSFFRRQKWNRKLNKLQLFRLSFLINLPIFIHTYTQSTAQLFIPVIFPPLLFYIYFFCVPFDHRITQTIEAQVQRSEWEKENEVKNRHFTCDYNFIAGGKELKIV